MYSVYAKYRSKLCEQVDLITTQAICCISSSPPSPHSTQTNLYREQVFWVNIGSGKPYMSNDIVSYI